MATNRVDVSAAIERQKLSGFLVALVVTSWTIRFFDGYDMNVIGFAAPYFAKEFDLSRVMIGNLDAAGVRSAACRPATGQVILFLARPLPAPVSLFPRSAFIHTLTTRIVRCERYPSPEFCVIGIQLFNALLCLFIIGRVKVDRAQHVAVFIQNVNAVMRHWSELGISAGAGNMQHGAN